MKRTNTKGLVIVITGDGKGKTSSSMGMALRSLQHGYDVGVVQFIKTWHAIEQKAFQSHYPDQIQWFTIGGGFTWDTNNKEYDTQLVRKAWDKSLELIVNPEIKTVVLDEIIVALDLNYLPIDEVLEGLDKRPENCHTILTGRGAPEELLSRADMVNRIESVKHPFDTQGIVAQRGIEF